MASVVSATTIWYSSAMFHPSGSMNWYSFTIDRSDIQLVRMNSTSIEVGSFNYTSNSVSNVSFNYTDMPLRFHTTASENMTICPLSPTTNYEVYHELDGGGVTDVAFTSDSDGCLSFNTTSAGYTNIIENAIGCRSVQYSMVLNYTAYKTGYNQTFDFRCLPNQTACQPRYQNKTRYGANWTNNLGADKSVWMTLNHTQSGYMVFANNASTYSTSKVLGTSRVHVGDAVPGVMQSFWFYINTYYPYEDYRAYINMEVCS